MPPPFKQIDREQFAGLVQRFDFRRSIDAVHMHHTWRPNTRILRAGIEGVSNEQFGQRIAAEFGAGARQRPLLDCAPAAGARALLAPLVGAGPGRENDADTAAGLATVKRTL